MGEHSVGCPPSGCYAAVSRRVTRRTDLEVVILREKKPDTEGHMMCDSLYKRVQKKPALEERT